ncbi:copper-binding protein (DUF461 domain) [Campylobacter pinnipediorum subsp. caledonicus]|uniref:Copper-binding protein (DUF461 domain) n=1 Tax=Campylobacter pinnipediorum subsp. caledonicus TaxID=1874362 RepID=A0A1S6U6U7_9BACT|nr:copper chaperone PCu(A)C [Campylobacter pinnipediorum]AQW85789.1 copper-binding protein (DUF461 domain) [Campylobacter pinnipediorum subsp. caledonicus]AQW87400.1 copper-binding protein (DUF461 domain) [Campylobacter pinnipediorum subsp. caledonicus]OPA72523.1 hypothetical protein BB381_05710 [Campylobacter pinnipediorum subsp. caledonicus]
MKKLFVFFIFLTYCFSGEIEISNVFAKQTMDHKNGAVFMDITNNLEADVKIIGASSSAYEAVELHTHKIMDNMMAMVKINDINIPKDSTIKLMPKGLHFMLFGAKKEINNNEGIDLTINFNTGKSVTIKNILLLDTKKKLFF